MEYCDILLEEMYHPWGIQLATEQTWRELGIPVNLGRRLKEALHPYQKERRQGGRGGMGGMGATGGTEGMGGGAYGYTDELEALQVLEAMRNGN